MSSVMSMLETALPRGAELPAEPSMRPVKSRTATVGTSSRDACARTDVTAVPSVHKIAVAVRGA